MAIDQIDSFMHSISALESGHNYNARGPDTGTYGHAVGRYQIMSAFYPTWAKEAGVDPNDMSPAAQDRVARHKMTQYYNQFGSWDLVAVAWFAGPGRAKKAQRSGVASVGGIKDMLGTSVSSYVSRVVGGMGQGSVADGGGGGAATATATLAPPQMELEPDPEVEAQMTQDVLGEILSTVSEASKGNGFGQVLDLKAMFGMPKPAPVIEGDPLMEGIPDPSDIPEQDPLAVPEGGAPLAPPPEHSGFAGLKDNAKIGSQQIMAAFPGLRFTSGYRDPQRNAAAGGVRTSKHLTGEASDFVGTEKEMQAAAAWAKSRGARVLVHDSGSGRHLHIEWA